MTPAEQRYEVSQIYAEGREKGWHPLLIVQLMLQWFIAHRIEPPADLEYWFNEMPADEWHPSRRATVH